MKQLIGIFRIVLALVLMYGFDVPLTDTFGLKIWVSDLIHGSHAPELRNSGSVSLVMFAILGVFSFYIIQSFVYIFIGSALEGKRTGLFRFLGYVVSGIQGAANNPYFWTSSSSSNDLSRIDEVLKYRDNKMALMDNRQAAEYMKGTGHIEHLMSRRDLKRSRQVLNYVNNKMNLMDNETALNYLKNQK